MLARRFKNIDFTVGKSTEPFLKIQMLANMDSSVMFHTTGLADDSTLCAKKDIIIAKFDQLLKKLGGEVNFSSPLRMLLLTTD